MRTARTAILATAISALALTSIGAPATAIIFGPEVVAVANGIPGQRIDVCVKGKEIRSRMPYGGWKQKVVTSGWVTVKAYKPDQRRCKGTLIAKRTFKLGVGEDVTLVVTKKKTAAQPNKIVLFDNLPLGTLVAPAAMDVVIAVRHAADIGKATFHLNSGGSTVFPTVDPIYKKGYYGYSWVDEGWHQVWVTRPDEHKVIASTNTYVKSFTRLELILVGTNLKNARLLRIRRSLALVP